MNKEQYLARRKTLLDELNQLITDNASEDVYNAKKDEITQLDNEYKTYSERMANAAALSDNGVSAFGSAFSGNGSMNLENAADDKTSYKDAFAKFMTNKALSVEEQAVFNKFNPSFSNSTTTAASNPVVIPKQTVQGIWTEMRARHAILEDVLPAHFEGTMEFIKGSLSDADQDWYDETEELDETDVITGSIILTGCELVKTVAMSLKMETMAVEDFEPWIVNELGGKMGAALAYAYVNGRGKPGNEDSFKPEPYGIITALNAESSVPQVVYYDGTTDPITYAKLTQLFSLILSGYVKTVYASNSTIWTTLANVLDENKRPYFITDTTAGGVGRLFGAVVKEESAVADGSILVGDVRNGYRVNTAKDITIERERLVKKRRIDYTAHMITDGAPMTTKAFALLTVNPSQG